MNPMAWFTVQKLKSVDSETVENAKKKLVHSRAVSTLVRALKDPQMRQHAADALFEIGGSARDLICIQRYWRHLAEEEWRKHVPKWDTACVRCSRTLDRDEGYSSGSYDYEHYCYGDARSIRIEGCHMYCEDCMHTKLLQPEFLGTLEMVISGFSNLQEARDFASPAKTIRQPIQNLKTICVGFVNIKMSEEEAFQLGVDLMERWNPKLFSRFQLHKPDAKMRIFQASSLEKLTTILSEVAKQDYIECSAILQTGSFDVVRRSTDLKVKGEVALATFWKSQEETKLFVVAPGLELTIEPT